MNQEILSQLGLSRHQISAYQYLLEHGPAAPPELAKKLKLTRSNAYKVLDQLVEVELISRIDLNKKLHYKAEDPIVLASLVAEERNKVRLLESNVKAALTQFREIYRKGTVSSDIQVLHGVEAVKSLYKHQSDLKSPIYFVKSRSDIPFMGYETMDAIRKLSVKFGTHRYGIVPDAPEASIDPKIDRQVNLTKTWIPSDSYTAPVEWTVSGDELMILIFGDASSGIRIKNPIVADAFKQLWQVLSESLQASPDYKKLPRKAKRKV
jgi:sugar-specific transcriptional regulator TrmB